ncbi:MAG: peptidoglycan-binding protein [Elainellaceae cyanobacterium]
MEILAFTYAASAYEDPSPAPELQINLAIKLPSSAWVGVAALAVGLSIVGTAPSAMAAQLGDRGPEVTAIQQALLNLGFNPGLVDGIFGLSTEQAVRAFQASEPGLVVDGIAGPATETVLGLRDGTAPIDGGTDPGPAILQQGDRGEAVVELQEALRTLGFFPATATASGFYGTLTTGAVESFQSENGLIPDGVAGPQTQARLFALTVSEDETDPVVSNPSILQEGDRGDAVIDVQDALRALGFFPEAIASTGFYGAVTVQAVQDFQTENGLIPDGVAGPQTQGLLFSNVTTDPGPDNLVSVSTSGSFLNVRSGPGLSFPVVSSLANGTVVRATGEVSNGWIRLSQGGWVSSDFVI